MNQLRIVRKRTGVDIQPHEIASVLEGVIRERLFAYFRRSLKDLGPKFATALRDELENWKTSPPTAEEIKRTRPLQELVGSSTTLDTVFGYEPGPEEKPSSDGPIPFHNPVESMKDRFPDR